ncbi:hypothetical protein BaRGS_00009124, partial [Batillaria attramentaria]
MNQIDFLLCGLGQVANFSFSDVGTACLVTNRLSPASDLKPLRYYTAVPAGGCHQWSQRVFVATTATKSMEGVKYR